MKFLRAELENWRPFRGESSIDFSSAAKQPITLVFGKNGGGKTSMLTGMHWCLYGKMDLEDGKGDQNLVNDYVVQAAGVTKADPVYATVTLYISSQVGGNELLYRITRRQQAYGSGNSRKEKQAGLAVRRVTPAKGYRPGDDVSDACEHSGASCENFEGDKAQDLVDKLLPHGLARYFFYPGETLSFPFKNDPKSTRLLKGFLIEISGGSKFEPFEKSIKQTKKRLDANSKDAAKADEVTRKLQEDIEVLRKEEEEAQQNLPNIEAELDAAVQNLESVEGQLEKIDSIADFLGAAERARDKEETAGVSVEEKELAVTEALEQANLVVASQVFDKVTEVFGKRKYPNDISSSLLGQLREKMECICGRDLTEKMLETLKPLSPTDDSVVTRMHTLNGRAISWRVSGDEESKLDKAIVNLKDAQEKLTMAIEGRASAEVCLTAAGGEEFDTSNKDNLVRSRSNLKNKIRQSEDNRHHVSASIKERNAKIEKKETEKRDQAPRGEVDIHTAALIARQLEKLLADIQAKQSDVAREQLEKLINDNFVLFKENIQVEVDSDFQVKVIDYTETVKIEKPVGDLAGSEIALLTYAFAAAAAKLLPQYQTLDKLLTTTPVFGEVEQIPLVVDAPFSNLGQEYKRRVMELMAQGFSQVIMFTESSDTDVLSYFAEVLGAEYLVHLKGDFQAEGVETTFSWKQRTFTYASPSDEAPQSTIEPLEH